MPDEIYLTAQDEAELRQSFEDIHAKRRMTVAARHKTKCQTEHAAHETQTQELSEKKVVNA